MSEKPRTACFSSVSFRLFLFDSHLLRVSHKARHFAFLRGFLRLLRLTNVPLAFVVFNDLSFVEKLLKNLSRSLVFESVLSLLD